MLSLPCLELQKIPTSRAWFADLAWCMRRNAPVLGYSIFPFAAEPGTAHRWYHCKIAPSCSRLSLPARGTCRMVFDPGKASAASGTGVVPVCFFIRGTM